MPPKRSSNRSKQRGSNNASVTSTSALSRADRRKIISQKRSAPTPPRVVASTTNDADVASPLSTATGMSPGIPTANAVAILRNLSKSNASDFDDEEYDDEGNPLATGVEDAINDDAVNPLATGVEDAINDDEGNPRATVVEDAINDSDNGGGKRPPVPPHAALPPPALSKFDIDRLRELSKFNPNNCGGDDDAPDDDDNDDGGGKLPGETKRVRPGEGFN
jgi:hypothetical protein